MIAPGAIVICTPILCGLLFGYRSVSGLLAGNIVSGIQIAFSASNTGGAWDNCKKYVEAGHLQRMPDQIARGMNEYVKKGDDEHKAAVVGDTVGDPLKDTSGPAINILIKLSAIVSLVFGGFIADYGGLIAGK
jgi:Na+/H+-translocating membrane pyrophosphatase